MLVINLCIFKLYDLNYLILSKFGFINFYKIINSLLFDSFPIFQVTNSDLVKREAQG